MYKLHTRGVCVCVLCISMLCHYGKGFRKQFKQYGLVVVWQMGAMCLVIIGPHVIYDRDVPSVSTDATPITGLQVSAV